MSTLDPEPPFRALISLPESGRPSVKLRAAMRSMGQLEEIASDATSSRIGRASQLFVDCQTRLHGIEFCAYRPERVAADQEVLRRLRHVDQSEDRRRSPVRIAQLLAALIYSRLPDWIEQGVVVTDGTRAANHRTAGPVCPERSGGDSCDCDAEAFHLFCQRLGDPFEGELAATVVADAGHRDVASHRRDVDYVATPALTHER